MSEGAAMPSVYLGVAERVLTHIGRPLHPKDILLEARRLKLLPKDLYGSRQDRTLQARLSEDIVARGAESRFFRTSAGKFFLRHLRNGDIGEIGEFFARPRRKELRAKDILTLDRELSSQLREHAPVVTFARILGRGLN